LELGGRITIMSAAQHPIPVETIPTVDSSSTVNPSDVLAGVEVSIIPDTKGNVTGKPRDRNNDDVVLPMLERCGEESSLGSADVINDE
jgi:hypothetical protein